MQNLQLGREESYVCKMERRPRRVGQKSHNWVVGMREEASEGKPEGKKGTGLLGGLIRAVCLDMG